MGTPSLSESHYDLADFECSLCLKLLFDPTVSPTCGHSFCRRCAHELIICSASAAGTTTLDDNNWMSTTTPTTSMNLRCPICRTCIDRRWTPSSCLVLGRLLQRTFPVEYAARAAEEQHDKPLPRLPYATSPGQKILPLFVLDSLLPGQRMFLHVFEVRYRLLIQRAMADHNRRFGMVGRSISRTPQLNGNDGVAYHGTEVEILSCVESPDGRFRVAVQGRSIFRVVDKELRDGYWEATVEDVNHVDNGIDRINESRMGAAVTGQGQLATSGANTTTDDSTDEEEEEDDDDDSDNTPNEKLGEHVICRFRQWEEYVVQNRWERHSNQLEDVKSALGTMPVAEEEQKLAIWVAAAINPLPPLGVAREIRPAVLAATNPLRQLQIVSKALDESIQLVQHRRGTVNVFGLGRIDAELGTWIILGLVAWWFLQGYIQSVVMKKFGLEPALLGIFGVVASGSNGGESSSSEL
eukprot:scaffold2039_cov183-Amphora_coffeaeformis.AAC.1